MDISTKSDHIYSKIITLVIILLVCNINLFSQSHNDYVIIHNNRLKYVDSLVNHKQFDLAYLEYQKLANTSYILNELDTNRFVPKDPIYIPIQKSFPFSDDSLIKANYFNYPLKIENSLLSISDKEIINLFATQSAPPFWYISKAIEMNDSFIPKLYYERAIHNYFLQKYNLVIEDFERINFGKDYINTYGFIILGNTYYELGDYQKALEIINEGLKQNQKEISLFFQLNDENNTSSFIEEGLRLNRNEISLLDLYFDIIIRTKSTKECLVFIDSVSNLGGLLSNFKYRDWDSFKDKLVEFELMDLLVKNVPSDNYLPFLKERYKNGSMVPYSFISRNGIFIKPLYFYRIGEYDSLNVFFDLDKELGYNVCNHFVNNHLLKVDYLKKTYNIDSAIVLLLDFEKKISEPSEKRRIILVSLFDCYKAKKNLEKCFDISQQLLEEYQNCDVAYEKRGEFYELVGDIILAEKFYKKTLEINEFEPYANYRIGKLLISQNRLENAKIYFEKVLASNLDDYEILNEVKELLEP